MALPYGLKVHWEGCDYGDKTKNLVTTDEFGTINDEFQVEDCKPYLRPMSSMTEEEKGEYLKTKIKVNRTDNLGKITEIIYYDTVETYSFLLEHHFDFMGLIPMNAAIDCTDLNIYKD